MRVTIKEILKFHGAKKKVASHGAKNEKLIEEERQRKVNMW